MSRFIFLFIYKTILLTNRFIMPNNHQRRVVFTKGFLSPKNVDDMFQKVYNNERNCLGSDERDKFSDFMEYVAKKNEKKDIDVKTANKYVQNEFIKLWKIFNKEYSKIKSESFAEASNVKSSGAVVSHNVDETENYASVSTPQVSSSGRRGRGRRGGRIEHFQAPNEDYDAHDFMRDDPSYNYNNDSNRPGKVNYNNRRVPYNYNNKLPPPSSSTFDSKEQVFGIKSKFARKMFDTMPGDVGDVLSYADEQSQDVHFGPPLGGPGVNLMTDGGNPDDYNVTMAKGPNDSRVEQEYIIPLDSRLRDIALYPNSNDYSFSLTELLSNDYGYIREIRNGLSNIMSIEILYANIPNIIRDSTTQFYEPYVYMDIAELSGNIRTGVDSPSRVFSQFYYINSDTIRDTPHLTLTPVNGGKHYPLNNLLKDLKKLTVRWYNFDGELFDFGSDSYNIQSITPGTTTTIQTTTNNNLQTGDRIYIRGFISGDNRYDRDMNRTKGFIVSVDTPDTFEIQLDTTGIPATQASGKILIAKLQNSVSLRIRVFSTDIGN